MAVRGVHAKQSLKLCGRTAVTVQDESHRPKRVSLAWFSALARRHGMNATMAT